MSLLALGNRVFVALLNLIKIVDTLRLILIFMYLFYKC